jgi:hypothetical protein
MAEPSLSDLASLFAAQQAPPPEGALSRLGVYLENAGRGVGQMLATPGAAAQPNPYPQGSEEAAWYDNNRQGAMNQWGPQMALSMLGAGGPMAEAGALGAGGGRLRNQFTGAFRKEGETPLPGNPYRSVNTQAKPVAANSAEAQARYGFPGGQAPVDPALLEANLARLDNPMAQQVRPAPAPPQRAVMPNAFEEILAQALGRN